MPPDPRPVARRLAASLATSWVSVQIVGALSSVIAFRLTGDLALAGLPYFAFSLGSSVAAVPAGRLMDRHGRVPVLVGGHAIVVLGLLVGLGGIWAASFPLFLLGALVTALGSGATYLTRMAAADLYPPERRGRGVALVVVFATVGAVLGTPVIVASQRMGAALAIDYALLAWGAAAALSLAAALIVARIRPDPRRIALELQAERPAVGALAASAPGLAGHALPLAGLILLLAQASMVTVMAIAGASLEHAGHTPTLVGATMTAHLVGMFAFTPLIGQLADRVGRRPVLVASAAILLLGDAAVYLYGAGFILPIALLLVGLGWSFAFIGATAVVADATHALQRGRVTGLIDFATAGFAALASLAGGWALARGGLPIVAELAGALALGIAAATLLLPAQRARPGPAASGPL